MKYFEKKFNLQMPYLQLLYLFHEYLFSPELSRAARLLKTSCFENILCVIETMLVI